MRAFIVFLIFSFSQCVLAAEEINSESALKYLDPSELRKINEDNNKSTNNLHEKLNSDNVNQKAQDYILEQEKNNQHSYEYESPATEKAKQLRLDHQRKSDTLKDKKIQYNISN